MDLIRKVSDTHSSPNHNFPPTPHTLRLYDTFPGEVVHWTGACLEKSRCQTVAPTAISSLLYPIREVLIAPFDRAGNWGSPRVKWFPEGS